MTTRLEYRHTNGNDSVVLVDLDSGLVRSDWAVTPDVLRDYCDCSQDAADWHDRFGDHQPDDYGSLVSYRSGYELTAVDAELWAERVARYAGA